MHTRKYALVLLVLMMAVPLVAQVPKLELFGGYSFSNGDGITPLGRLNLNGWNVAVAGNVNRWFGVLADFSGHYGTSNVTIPVVCIPEIECPPQPTTLKANNHTFLFGPRFSLRRGRVMPFAHALLGGERLSIRMEPPSGTWSRTGFAVAVGGGIDISVASRLAWRFQTDYLPVRQFSQTQNNVRLSTGVVLHFGK